MIFQNLPVQHFFSGIYTERQIIWIQIRPVVQTVCKRYKETTKVATSSLGARGAYHASPQDTLPMLNLQSRNI